MKGAFLLRSDARRARAGRSAVRYFPGQAVYALALRRPRRAAPAVGRRPSSMHWGAGAALERRLRPHLDQARGGQRQVPRGAPAPRSSSIWQIAPGRARRARHALLRRRAGGAVRVARRRRDAGRSNRGLWDHPAPRRSWQPGGGGLCLHTILPDPDAIPTRMHVAISTGGVYRTDDGGAHAGRPRNHGVRAAVPARPVSRVRPVRAQGRARIRRGPSGCSCRTTGASTAATTAATRGSDIANGVPSDFGFAMAMHPHDPDTRVHRAARVRQVPLHARGQAARLPHARRRRARGSR